MAKLDDEVVGKKIVKVRPMTLKEKKSEGWDEDRRSERGVVIELEGGTKLYPSRDDEGNGPGVMFGAAPDGKTFRLSGGA